MRDSPVNRPNPARARFERRPLATELGLVDAVGALLRGERPMALVGAWAGGGAIVVSDPVRVAGRVEDPFDLLAEVPTVEPGAAGVGGGWFGYLGYQLGGRLERVGAPRQPAPEGTAYDLAYYDNLVRYDATTGRWWFECLAAEGWTAGLEARFDEVQRRLAQAPRAPAPGRAGRFRPAGGSAAHIEAIEQAIAAIHAGQVFQVNICMSLEGSWQGDPKSAFLDAAEALRPPYAAYLEPEPGRAVACLSPELFLRRRGRHVESRPIKGTCVRDADAGTAALQRDALLASDKNRAENVMIVDLMRSDLGRVAATGSVQVPGMVCAEAHPGVWHLVSRVEAVLRPEVADSNLLRACFPPGSITGAPKIRAMQLINELEAAARGVYTGAIGYVSPVAGLELNVAIRTFEIDGGRARLGVGGGIVSDSDPAAELAECRHKAGPLLAAVGGSWDPDDA